MDLAMVGWSMDMDMRHGHGAYCKLAVRLYSRIRSYSAVDSTVERRRSGPRGEGARRGGRRGAAVAGARGSGSRSGVPLALPDATGLRTVIYNGFYLY
jgi:hypothetical protein